MPLTITVADPLAIQLQSEAASRKISVEQFALEVLGQAVQSDEWALANRRRLALIRQQFGGGLTAAEAAELQELQHRADRHLESLDSQRLNDVAEMEKAVAGESPRVRLRDLPTPPEVMADAQEFCGKYAWRGSVRQREVQEQLKLQYYYGGQAVYVLRTSDGLVVVPIPEVSRETPDLRYVLLTAEERPHACLEVPPPWRDTISEILT